MGIIRACEVCGKKDNPTGVASSTLGAFSLNYCGICNAMWAEPQVDKEELKGMREEYSTKMTYYDKATDQYKAQGNDELVPIKLKDGIEFNTRTDYINHRISLRPDSVKDL